MDESGVSLIVVGVGTPESATRFCNSLGFPKDNLYCDPDMKIYKDVGGLQSGALATFASPASIKSIFRQGVGTLREATKNYDTSLLKPPRNEMAFQQGGLFVFDKDRRLVYGHCDQGTADHAPQDQVMHACCSS